MRHSLSLLSYLRKGLPLLAFLMATSVVLSGDDTTNPPARTAVPSQPAPVNIQSLPPGTMLSPGTIATPAATLPAGAAPPGVVVDGSYDYWIVSSRRCGGSPSATNTGCLNFFHRTSERQMPDLGREAFLASIRPDQPVCFVVHGSYNRWSDVVTESRKICRWVRSASPGAPVQVVFFTWPSDGNMPFIFPVDIAMLGRKASQHSFYLAHLIGQIPPDQPVCMLGHSHGARAVVAALHLLGGGAIEDGQMLPAGYSTPRIRAVLIAAAIDTNWFNPGQRYSQALQVPEQVLLMRNSRDATLAIYPLRFGRGGRAMGREGLGTQDRFAINQMGKKVVELDAAQFAGTNHSFADYHERTELASAIIPYVHFDGMTTPGSPRGEPIQPATPATAARKEPLRDAEPITPSKRAAPNDGPALVGPKLAPVKLSPPPDADDPPARAQSSPAPDGTVKIYPKSRPALRDSVGPQLPLPAEGEPAKSKESPPKAKKRNPFQLHVEP